MNKRLITFALLTLVAILTATIVLRPPHSRPQSTNFTGDDSNVQAWHRVEDFDVDIAQFETVFWEPEDTRSLRELIRQTSLVRGKRVLEIGTGTGLLSLCCLRAGASEVVATDVNTAALANARFNAERLGVSNRLETRLVSMNNPGAFAVIGSDERFDLIVSNPPWEDRKPERVQDAALYDEGFQLLRSLLEGAEDHLTPGGQMLLAYGHVPAIRKIQELAPQVKLLDDRPLHSLPESFLPGMLLTLEY